MKQIATSFFAILLCVSISAQQAMTADYDFSADYNKYM